MCQHLGGICVDAKGARLLQFGLAVAAREKAHRERSPATRGEHIPNAIANHNAIFHGNAQPLGGADKYVGSRLGLCNIVASDHHCVSRGVVPDDSVYTTGTIGLLGTKPSQEAMESCDVLLMGRDLFPLYRVSAQTR